MYIFWKYDHFPFMLGGKTEGRKSKDGYYNVVGYGSMRFEPVHIMKSNIKGEKLVATLRMLENAYALALNELKSKYKSAADAALKNCYK